MSTTLTFSWIEVRCTITVVMQVIHSTFDEACLLMIYLAEFKFHLIRKQTASNRNIYTSDCWRAISDNRRHFNIGYFAVGKWDECTVCCTWICNRIVDVDLQ